MTLWAKTNFPNFPFLINHVFGITVPILQYKTTMLGLIVLSADTTQWKHQYTLSAGNTATFDNWVTNTVTFILF